jgi:hypothetical protein
MHRSYWLVTMILLCVYPSLLWGQLVGEGPRLGPIDERITQDSIVSGDLDLQELRKAGMKIFTTPFNRFDGMGDGPVNRNDTTSPGGRPTLQNNGVILRINGLDAQTCQECHSIVSTATVPPTLGVGGSGTIATVAMFMGKNIDMDDSDRNDFVAYDGRLIIPPHTFGVGGVQLLGKEMTEELQALKNFALENPGTNVPLVTKGVSFGSITADENGNLDTSQVEGIDDDLVVKPFGRKGEFATLRQIDQAAMMFHMGMQPVEIVGEGVDADGDGVVNEILVGELSALEIFLTTQDRPFQENLSDLGAWGSELFVDIGCADCHRPSLETNRHMLTYSLPEANQDPFANVFYEVDLSEEPTQFQKSSGGGLIIPLFSDLKRHDMGPELAEDFHGATAQQNRGFITAKLWGVRDTAPYMHDSRAPTLGQAILLHGGEASDARYNFADLTETEKNAVLEYLRSLRTPVQPNADVIPNAQRRVSDLGQ